MASGLAGFGGPKSADLVAKPCRLLVMLELHRDVELLLQPLKRTERLVAFQLLPPLEEELELGALPLVILLTVIGEEPSDGRDTPIDVGERGTVVSPGQGLRRLGATVHHLDIGTVAIELDAIAPANRMLDHEGEETEVARRVPRNQVIAPEMEGREIAVIILKPLAHQDRTVLRSKRERFAHGGGGPLSGLVILEHGLVPAGPLTIGAPADFHLHQS